MMSESDVVEQAITEQIPDETNGDEIQPEELDPKSDEADLAPEIIPEETDDFDKQDGLELEQSKEEEEIIDDEIEEQPAEGQEQNDELVLQSDDELGENDQFNDDIVETDQVNDNIVDTDQNDGVIETGDDARMETDQVGAADPDAFHEQLREDIRVLISNQKDIDINTITKKQVISLLRAQLGYKKSLLKKHKDFIRTVSVTVVREMQDGPDDQEAEGAEEQGAEQEDIEDQDELEEAGEDSDHSGKQHKRLKKKKSKTKEKENKKSQKKTKSKKGKEGWPRKPLSAYFCFLEANRAKTQEEEPSLSAKELVSHMARLWNALNEEERTQYADAANEEKRRYDQEVADFRISDPEGYARMMEKGRKKDKEGAGEKKRKKPSKKAREDGDGYSGSQSEAEEENGGWFGEAMKADKKNKKRKGHDVEKQAEEEMEQRADHLIKKMRTARSADDAANLRNAPALQKLSMLPEVESETNKKEMKEKLLDAGLLEVFKTWLDPLPGNRALPSVHLRTSVYKILAKLPVTESRLLNCGGLGKVVGAYYRSSWEISENKTLLASLLSSWISRIQGQSTDYRNLAHAEEDLAQEILQRKQKLGDFVNPAQKFAQMRGGTTVPNQATFDFVRRPQEQVGSDDEDEAKRSSKKDMSHKATFMRKIAAMGRNSLSQKQAVVPQISRAGID